MPERVFLCKVLHDLAGTGVRPPKRLTKHTIVLWLADHISPTLLREKFPLDNTVEAARKVTSTLLKWGDLPGGRSITTNDDDNNDDNNNNDHSNSNNNNSTTHEPTPTLLSPGTASQT